MGELFRQELSVSELTSLIKRTLEEGFYGLSVTGEISNFRPASSGHWFFTLKDANAAISAVMFKSQSWRVDFTPKEGDRVVVTGSLDVYPPRGTYQIKCESMTLAGFGELLAELERRKRLFSEKGYFAAERKLTLPRYPQRVGLVTAPGSAALEDMLTILKRRAPSIEVVILPATVQGEQAPKAIAQRIEQANALLLCDVLLVGRGGGSVEDLLAFSDELVVQAIAESAIPVVTGIGHEIDYALADYAADLRAATPSAAAELISEGYVALGEAARNLTATLQQQIKNRLAIAEASVQRYDKKILDTYLQNLVSSKEFQLANAGAQLSQRVEKRLHEASSRLAVVTGQLQALSPLAILARGYAVVQDTEGKIIASKEDALPGLSVSLRFADGKRGATIKEEP